MKNWRILTLLAMLALLAALASCSSDDTTTPGEDTDAPLVVTVDPVQNDTDVAVGEDVTVAFNEDMDPATADGNVTLSHGTITDLSWTDARTLKIEHDDWPEGTQVTVTVGTGLTDDAGNGLEAAFAWNFWTYTEDVLLLNTLPADGAEDVALNTQVWLEFSASMDPATLPGAITVTSPGKVIYPYTLDGDHSDWALTFDDDLLASTQITVTVTTAAEDDYGNPLAADTDFSFTTGDAADTTPPQLLSVEPETGTTIPTSTSYIRMTFDEPVDDDSLEPAIVSGQLMVSMPDPDNAGVWSDNHTVFTIGLAPPLTQGAVFYVEFDEFADMQGNVNTDGFTWEVTVEGTPNFVPVVDTFLMYYSGYWENGPASESGEIQVFTKYEVKTGGEFWRWEADYHERSIKDMEIEFYDYDRLKTTASAIQFLGFHEGDSAKEDTDVTFNPPVDYLKLPVTTQSWDGTSTFSPVPVEGPTQVEYDIAILDGVTDLEGPVMGGKASDLTIWWMSCRTLVLDFTLTDGMETYTSGTDSIWFCPGVGHVRKVSDIIEGTETHSTILDLYMAGLEEIFND